MSILTLCGWFDVYFDFAAIEIFENDGLFVAEKKNKPPQFSPNCTEPAQFLSLGKNDSDMYSWARISARKQSQSNKQWWGNACFYFRRIIRSLAISRSRWVTMRRIYKGKSTLKDMRIPIPPHGQIQKIKRNKNDHERTSDDNDDVWTLYIVF